MTVMVCPGLKDLQEVILFAVDVSVAVPGNTALLFAICIVPVLARMTMGMFAARQSFRNSIESLLYIVLCDHQRATRGLFLFPVVPFPLNSSAIPGPVALFRMGSTFCPASYFGVDVFLCHDLWKL